MSDENEKKVIKLGLKDVMAQFIGVLVLVLLVPGLLTAYHTVDPEGRAVVKRFGKVIDIRDPGLHLKLPFGIDKIYFVPTERQLNQEFGFRTISTGARTQYDKRPNLKVESLMLTGDLKVIDVEWIVQYRIDDPDKYLHRVKDPTKAIRDISESVMRRIVGNSLGTAVLTEKRMQVAQEARDEIEKILKTFELGISVRRVELQDVTPPESVKPAFNEVNQAEQEREKLINEAEKRRSQVIPRAEGQALQTVQEAQAYASERINRALGEAERFKAILNEYKKSPELTRMRLYLETMEKLLPKINNIWVVEEGMSSPIPLLNLQGESITSPAGRK